MAHRGSLQKCLSEAKVVLLLTVLLAFLAELGKYAILNENLRILLRQLYFECSFIKMDRAIFNHIPNAESFKLVIKPTKTVFTALRKAAQARVRQQ